MKKELLQILVREIPVLYTQIGKILHDAESG